MPPQRLCGSRWRALHPQCRAPLPDRPQVSIHSMKNRLATITALCAIGFAPLSAEDAALSRWPQFHGANASGLSAGAKPPEDWDIMKAETKRSENVVVAVKPGGTGNITGTHVAWSFRKGLPYVSSPVLYDGRLYFVKDGGLLTSLDARTGEPAYVQERITGASGGYYASLVAGDGRLYVASLPGKLTVIRMGGDKPEILHQADFGERIPATPEIVGERFYVRTTTKLWAFGK